MKSIIFASLLAQYSRAQEVSIPMQVISVPEDCNTRTEAGDHVLLRFTYYNAASPEAPAVFELKPWEQRHFVLGDPKTPRAFNEALVNMCEGERRRLTFPAEDFDFGYFEAETTPIVKAEVELLTLTTSFEYQIFDFIKQGEVGSLLDLVEKNTGINAVDEYGHSALMAAVQAGSKMHMAVASLLNAWKPKVNVNFAKPSGHSALFYAAILDDTKGTGIIKALLTRGADPNVALRQPDLLGWTPLHFACKSGNLKNAALLLEYGANPLAETAKGESVLDVAKDIAFSARKRLATILNEAVERLEVEEGNLLDSSPHSEL